MASEAVFDKAAISVPFSNLIFMIFQSLRVGPEVHKWHLKS